MSTSAIRPAAATDIPALSQVMGRAFVDDPVLSWIVPDRTRRQVRLPRLFAALARGHLDRGGVEISTVGDRVAAAAMWAAPGQWRLGGAALLRMLPALIGALGRDMPRARVIDGLTDAQHPREPHWYLGDLGSDPDFRGGGHARALLDSGLDRCDREGAPAYLESSNEVNLPYYERFGFVVTGELVVPDGGPTLWAMWRDPA